MSDDVEKQLNSDNNKKEAKETADVVADFLTAPVETGKKAKKVSKVKKGKSKKKVFRPIPVGNAYITATYNNTIVSLSDQTGNVIAFSSAGLNGFKGPKKATPFAASIIVRDAVEKAKLYGLKDVNVYVKGVGMGRDSAVRALNANGLNVLLIKDVTPIPHNGCRKRKPRRV